jgi:hypothetical protein
MADGADLPALVAETIKLMGSCIKKPPMTEKLLSKPPFRFLHDTITEVSLSVRLRTAGSLAWTCE